MPQVRIFKYPTRKTAVFVTGKERNYNMPIQNSIIKVYQGANVPLDFNIFDADGKPLNYDGTNKHLELKVFDQHTNRIAFIKRLEQVQDVTQQDKAGALMPSVRQNNYKRSIFRTVVEVTDTVDLTPGTHYRWVVMEQSADNDTGYFYSSLDHRVEGELHISSHAAPQVEPSTVLSDASQWTKYTKATEMDYNIVGGDDNAYQRGWTKYVSSAMAGDAQINIIDGIHTLAVYADNLSCVLQVQACLESELPDGQSQHRWFNVPLCDGQVNIEFTDHTGVEPLNFVGNFVWIRIVIYKMEGTGINTGSVKRILVRR